MIEVDDGIRLKFLYVLIIIIINIQNCYKLLYIQINFGPKLQTDFIDHSKNVKMVIDYNDYAYGTLLNIEIRQSLLKYFS